MEPQENQRLHELLDALCEESMSVDQMRELEDMIASDPAVEAYYVQYVSIWASLSRAVDSPASSHFPTSATDVDSASLTRSEHNSLHRHSGNGATFALSAIVVALLGVIILQGWQYSRWKRGVEETFAKAANAEGLHDTGTGRTAVETSGAGTFELVDEGVALLVQSIDAKWQGESPREGMPLNPGEIALQTGLAKIEFYSGATIVLQGPAELELLSSSEARLVRGRLRANVPQQASGFAIETPQNELVELGSEFGLEVGEDNKTEIVVFEGKVELYDLVASPNGSKGQRNTESRRVLTDGEIVRVDQRGEARRIPESEAVYVSVDSMNGQVTQRIDARRSDWDSATQQWRADADVLAFYDFEETFESHRKLVNRSLVYEGMWDGVVVGCESTGGCWPWSRSLEMRRVSDRVRIHLLGKYPSLTLASWVRIDSLPNRYCSLLMSDGFEEGEIHWQIDASGCLALGVQGFRNANGYTYRTEPVITATNLGQWVHVAAVFDAGNGTVTHFLNGVAVATEEMKDTPLLHVGSAEIGNWNVAEHQSERPVRNFVGRIDQLLVARRPLSAGEIGELHSLAVEGDK